MSSAIGARDWELTNPHDPKLGQNLGKESTPNRVEIECRGVVDADWGLLNRVLSNLIENEIAHLPIACQITIRAWSREGSAMLVIEDDGTGFPPDISARALERFV